MIRIDYKFRLLRSDEKMNRFVFNRQGRGTYVMIQAGRLAEGQLSLDHGKDVESWMATLSRQQIQRDSVLPFHLSFFTPKVWIEKGGIARV